MFSHHLANEEARTELDYKNTITHEMGHVFGLDDGYPSANFEFDNTLRPEADMLEAADVMHNNHLENTFVSNIDIQMLLLAAETGEWQYYMNYLGNNQSLGVQTGEMCEDD